MKMFADFLARTRRVRLITGLLLLLGVVASLTVAATVPIPRIAVDTVSDGVVSGHGWNLPAGATFNIRMGVMGSRAENGPVVGTATVAADGTVTYSVSVPDSLKDQRQIAIRLDGYLNYYSFAWFWNPVAAAPAAGAENENGEATEEGAAEGQAESAGYVGYPTFAIAAVDGAAHTVTINGRNFPPNQTFTFRINGMWTQGYNGEVIGTLASGQGGDVTETFNVPEGFHGYSRLAIRADSPAGYYAYNWFWTGSAAPAVAAPPTGSGSSGAATGTGGQPAVGTPATTAPAAPAAAYPTFAIASVARGATVTIVTRNLPANMDFTVIMGDFGTRGLSGYQVASFNSGDGGTQTLTFSIPSALAANNRVAIRLQGVGNPYYAFNWFWNN